MDQKLKENFDNIYIRMKNFTIFIVWEFQILRIKYNQNIENFYEY